MLSFLPLLVALGLAAVMAGTILLLNSLLGPRLRTRRKLETYESGVPVLDSSHKRISIAFFLVAIDFIVFDLEAAGKPALGRVEPPARQVALRQLWRANDYTVVVLGAEPGSGPVRAAVLQRRRRGRGSAARRFPCRRD